tara:strand:+ start:1894 stop:2244 length:351 start_codon:yes stop_codon:yes gene_type:complete
MNKKVKKMLDKPFFLCYTGIRNNRKSLKNEREEMSGLIIPVRANGTIAPYPVSAPTNGMSENDLEGFLAAQGFEVREEPKTRKIGFVAVMNRDTELKNEKEEEAKAAELVGDSRPL